MNQRNCLSYWFPRLQLAGLPVPRTEVISTDVDLTPLLDGQRPSGWDGFCERLVRAMNAVGAGPWFLRTGQGSGKHDWKQTCYLTPESDLRRHVAALVEWSHLVDFFGLPHDVWCVRELLPVEPVGTLPRYGDMPLVAEVRAFIEGGRVVCHHDYWPLDAIRAGLDRDGDDEAEAERLFFASAVVGDDRRAAVELAGRVAEAFAGDGSWSVDLLPTRRGWFVTDMAEAGRSFHWPGCENERRQWAA